MKAWSNLRLRIVASFVAVGAVLGTLFAGAALLAAWYMERTFVETTVAEELEYFISQVVANPGAASPATTSFKGWHAPLADLEGIPGWLRELPPGLHELPHQERWYEVAVRDHQGRRFYLTYDETRVQQVKALLVLFLIGGVLAVSYLALWLGFSTAERIIEPVTRLATRVHDTDRKEGPPLAPEFGDDEVGELARAFDGYSLRIRELLRREQELTADASHELRTGLAVIAGTTELLLEMPELSEAARDRLGRIERAALDLRRVTEAFLLLARTPAPAVEPCAAAPVLRQLVDRHQELAGRRQRRLALRIEDEGTRLPVPAEVLSIVVENLLDNALTHGSGGPVEVELDAGGVTVRDQGPGIPPSELPHIFERTFRGQRAPVGGSGLGLAISRRLSDRFGGSLTLASGEQGGTTARLSFRS